MLVNYQPLVIDTLLIDKKGYQFPKSMFFNNMYLDIMNILMFPKTPLLQVCDFCDSTNEAKKHPPEFAVDGMETWWQSPPLSRGMKYNEINLTIDLGQVTYLS